jgi:hypothetical protein
MTYRPLPLTVAHWDRLIGTLRYELPLSPHTGVDAAQPPHTGADPGRHEKKEIPTRAVSQLSIEEVTLEVTSKPLLWSGSYFGPLARD